MSSWLGTGDGYLRISSRAAIRHSRVPTVPGSLVFVDLDLPSRGVGEVPGTAEVLAKRVVEAPPGFFLNARQVLVRWPLTEGLVPPSAELRSQASALSTLITARSARTVDVGLTVFPFNDEPTVKWSTEAPFDEACLLARARAVELSQMLAWGRAIWAPLTYHYQLPSGEHSGLFVRVADSFRSARDAAVAATWLHRHLAPGLGIAIDSSTILPVVLALQNSALAGGFGEVSVVSLGDYPATRFEVDRAVDVLGASERILGLLSVTSTGQTGHHIADAIERVGRDSAVETLVNRAGPSPVDIGRANGGAVLGPWVGLGVIRESFANRDDCELCGDPARARVVYIDPRSFEPMVLPRPDLLMPAISEAQEAKDIWEFYDEVDGVGIHAQPHPTTLDFRGNRERLAIRCYPSWLLEIGRYDEPAQYRGFLDRVRARSGEVAARLLRDQRTLPREERFASSECDLVVTTVDDAGTDGFGAFLGAIAAGFGCPSLAESVVTAVGETPRELSDDAKAKVVAARHVLVITLGALTGTTMQQLLVAVHDAVAESGGDGPQLAGLVMHARPEDSREWEVLRNAYSGRLNALWLTYLSLVSPFDDELEVLNTASLGNTDLGTEYLQRRLELFGTEPDWSVRVASTEGRTVDPWAVFWGMPLIDDAGRWRGRDAPRLRPGSRFGQRVRTTTTFAAVGSAVQHARLRARPKGAPSWQQFELPAVLRSYFDPPIVAAILRWLHPHEAWWGDRDEDAANVIAEALARSTSTDLKLLLPELLLAAAQGKVPRSGVELLRSEAETVCRCASEGNPIREGEPAWTVEEIGPLEAAVRLLGDPSRAVKDSIEEVADGVKNAVARLDGISDHAAIAGGDSASPAGAARATAFLRRDLKSFLRSLRRLDRDISQFEADVDGVEG